MWMQVVCGYDQLQCPKSERHEESVFPRCTPSLLVGHVGVQRVAGISTNSRSDSDSRFLGSQLSATDSMFAGSDCAPQALAPGGWHAKVQSADKYQSKSLCPQASHLEMCCMFDTYSSGHCLQSCRFLQFERKCILISDEQCATGTLISGVPGGGYLPCAPTGVGTSPSGGSEFRVSPRSHHSAWSGCYLFLLVITGEDSGCGCVCVMMMF